MLSVSQRTLTMEECQAEGLTPFVHGPFASFLDAMAERMRSGHSGRPPTICVLDLAGAVVEGETEEFRPLIEALAEAGVREILLNFENVSSIDDYGAGEIIRSFPTVSRANVQLFFANVPKDFVHRMDLDWLWRLR